MTSVTEKEMKLLGVIKADGWKKHTYTSLNHRQVYIESPDKTTCLRFIAVWPTRWALYKKRYGAYCILVKTGTLKQVLDYYNKKGTILKQ